MGDAASTTNATPRPSFGHSTHDLDSLKKDAICAALCLTTHHVFFVACPCPATVSYTLLCFERKELVGVARVFRRRSCPSDASCCRSGGRDTTTLPPIPMRDHNDEERLPTTSSKQHLLSDSDSQDSDSDESEDSDKDAPSSSRWSFPTILFFAVPGAIYFFNNNLTFVLLSLMPAPTYVVLSNLKILTTGLFSYLFLKRHLTTIQWVSLGILFLSTAVSQVDVDKGLTLSISARAFLLMVLFCSLSAAASVFSEYVMKERFANESIHLQNMKLYMFGILFNGITYFATPPANDHDATAEDATTTTTPFFSDMSWIHLFIILAYASLGLVTSAIIKFSGSITKVYASSMSMFFAALVSWLLLNDQLTILFFVGCMGCCLALHLYYRVPANPSEPPSSATDDSEDEDEQMAQRRDSMASSSVTLEPPMTNIKGHSSFLESVKVVDRNEYVPLERR